MSDRTKDFQTPRFFWLLAILSTVAILCNGLWRGSESFWKYSELDKRKNELEGVVTALENEKKHVKTEILKIKSSSEYASKILKDRYHYKKKDETMVVVGEDGRIKMPIVVSKARQGTPIND